MELKKLEIKGFKSFADRIVIHFDKGTTGIVGPNGCGKSNIVDAIRWVLGEQKTKILRSDKIENIVFNGSKERKPTQLAEVSLTFNNTKNLIPTDYTQVTISRKYYRTGESEYLLNGVTCRLKDITSLFLDTGITSNSYAIIELQMVENLLSDKDNSRRMLFEEAAGISKFKIRKKETLKKMEHTDTDLERVEDLLFEIRKNLKSIEKEADKTKKYYKIKEKYKQMSVAMAKKTIDKELDKFSFIEQKIQTESDDKLKNNNLIDVFESKIEKSKSNLLVEEKVLTEKQKNLNHHINKIREYENDKKIKSERQKYLQEEVIRLNKQIKESEQSLWSSTQILLSLNEKLEEHQCQEVKLKNNIENLELHLKNSKEKTQENKEVLLLLDKEYTSKKEELFQLEKKIDINKMQLKSLTNELDKISEDSIQQAKSLETFQSELTEIDQRKTAEINRLNQINEREVQLAKEIETLKKQIDEIKEKLSKVERKLDARQNEYRLIKSMVDNLEGFPESIKFLKKIPEWSKIPLVSNIISCSEEYRITIENFLNPYIDFFIVNTRQEAIKAINLLNQTDKGKANFFILDELKRIRQHSLTPLAGSMAALDIVEYDSVFEPLIKFLLNNVCIMELIDIYKCPEGFTVIDKQGKIIFNGHQISGGSIGLFEGKKIGRSKNLERLGNEINQLMNLQKKFTEILYQKQSELKEKHISSETEKINQLKNEIFKIKETEISLLSKKNQYEELLSANAHRKKDIQEKIINMNISIEKLNPFYEKSKHELALFLDKYEQNKTQVQELENIQEEKLNLFNKENLSFLHFQNKLNSINQEILYKKENQEQVRDKLKEAKEGLQEVNQQHKELERKGDENDAKLISMYNEKETLESLLNETEKTYYNIREIIDNLHKKIRDTRKQKENTEQILSEWSNQLNETKIAINSVKQRLSVEFEINLEDVKEEDSKDFLKFTEKELNEEVQKLKTKMENMGSINPMAMSAFKEINERYEFITTQKEDLLEAKESLLSTIGQLDNVAEERFMKSFEQIKENFVTVFRNLFTEEDDCSLQLVNPSNPLESAIDIIAKPKGKRPLSINQLSGGEKTLTAISLLFAIYLIKPAPFCIFDEVDAPLDDANIDKFNQIIKKFSKNSQFIIVTHNKRTMVNTDVIYGITMQEQGVSKVIPVDLRQLA